MDEQEIEDWYKEEKENIVATRVKDREEGKDRQHAEQEYATRMKELTEKYQDLMNRSLERERRAAKIERLKKKWFAIVKKRIETIKGVFPKHENKD